MYIYLFWFSLFICFLLGSCSQPDKLEEALRLSGANRTELEKVLAYFSQHAKDSLKKKAAVFLIENMPGHYGPEASSVKAYQAHIDSTPRLIFEVRQMLSEIPLKRPQSYPDARRAEDIEHITAEYLIGHIESFIQKTDSCPWLQTIDFTTLCEYLLPYRIGNELLRMPDDSIQPLLKEMNYARQAFEDCNYTNPMLANYIRKTEEFKWTYPTKDTLIRNVVRQADNSNKIEVNRLRRLGIPVAIDFLPVTPSSEVTSWTRPIDPRYVTQTTARIQSVPTGKIFRYTYSRQPIPKAGADEYVPEFFRNPFYKDVTADYLNTIDLSLSCPVPTRYAYLAMPDGEHLQPVSYSLVDEGMCRFTHLGAPCIYVPIYYPEGKLRMIGCPFILQGNHTTELLPCRKDSLQQLTLHRIFPYERQFDGDNENLKNARFECADNLEFKAADMAYVITEAPYYKKVTVQTKPHRKSRYWRFYSRSYYTYMSEIHFIGPQGEELQGKYIGVDTLHSRFLTDHNPLTSVCIRLWWGMDFGKPVAVSKISYMSNKDGYNITPEHVYELYYFSDGQWTGTGERKATDDSLQFADVPTQGLYRVKDCTKNKWGRIFTWEEGKQRFW